MSNKKQPIPKWFKGTIYEKGATVRNRFSGDEYELNALEELIKNLRKGLNWFRTHNVKAYMVLLD